MEDKEILSDFFKARGRKYYFDIKEKENGDRYVSISERQPNNPKFKRMRIMVFEEYLNDFYKTMGSLIDKLKSIPKNPSKNLNHSSIEESEGNH